MTSTNEELVSQSAEELRRLIGIKQISPVELVDACIDRIETLNPAGNAVTATCFDAARREAKVAEQRVMGRQELGLLHGLPMGVKDLEDTAGLLTTYGSPISRGNMPMRDVVLVQRLRNQGAILLTKTNVPELDAGANTRNPEWGATGNPINTALNAGGSSGGSAAALACDMLPVCTGSDTGGSLRIQASKCGVVGFRTSPRLVPNSRRLSGWTPISVVGPMGRTVAEAALQLAATAGESVGDPLSYSVDALGFNRIGHIDLVKLRVGYIEDFGCCDVDESIRETFRSRVTALRGMFHTCEPVDFNLGEVHRCFDVIRAESFVAGLRTAYERDPSAMGPNTRELRNGRENVACGFRMGPVRADPNLPAFPIRVLSLRRHRLADNAGVALPQDGTLRFYRARQTAGKLLPVARAHLFRHTRDHPGTLLAVWRGRGRDAVRVADSRTFPWRLADVGDFPCVCTSIFRLVDAASSPPDLSHLREANPALNSLVTSPRIFNPSGSDASGLSMV